jgi:hypothetical protein
MSEIQIIRLMSLNAQSAVNAMTDINNDNGTLRVALFASTGGLKSTGNVLQVIGPSVHLSDHPDVAVAANTVDATIAANANRKSISIGSLSSNTGTKSLRVQAHPGAAVAKGFELVAGEFVNLTTQDAIDVFNADTGVAQTYWWQEYT